MLRVYLGSSNNFYVSFSNGDVAVADSAKAFRFAPVWGPFNLGGEIQSSIDFHGHIHDGELRRWGDRDCTHIYYEGELFFDSSIVPIPSDETKYVNRVANYGTVILETPMAPGREVLSPTYQGPKGRPLRTMYRQYDNFFITCLYQGPTFTNTVIVYEVDFVSGRYRSASTNFKRTSFEAILNGKYTMPTGGFYNVLNKIGSKATKLTPGEIYNILRGFRQVKFDANISRAVAIQDFSDPWGKLAQETVDRIAYADTNGLQYFPEMANFKKLCQQFLGVRFTSPKQLANAYLAFQYGAKSLVRDSDTYLTGLRRFQESKKVSPWKTSRASEYLSFQAISGSGTLEVERHYKIVYNYHEDAVLNAYRVLREWGLAPTVTAGWDAVPFSFVVDWFLDLEQVFKQIDDAPKRAMYRIIGVTKSEKISSEVLLTDWFKGEFVTGNVRYVNYTRTTAKKIDVPRFAYSTPTGFSNYAEALALIIQRSK